MTMTAPTKMRKFWTNITRPWLISSWSASMSEVIRETSRPVFSRSKKSSDSPIRWPKTRPRSDRRNCSPVRFTNQIESRPNASPRNAATR